MSESFALIGDRLFAYASTVYHNSLIELVIFLCLVSLWFFGRHMFLGWHARRQRKSLKLVLGGWGTRGKSGTERLKAGLMNAVGPSIVSKTTGCEAMFLIGTPFGGLTEMFLFRPYDKATIWEQYHLMKTSKGLNTKVFLWECMGLNPSYVRVLQRDWMRDDIATITNTYPDHEDIQGPAGRNIPEVMCEFIPEHSQLLTTEEEMLPILREGASQVGTQMREIGWKQAGLVHRELLARFPYEEHPYNIALVNAMGDELGLSHDFCVKEMSDRVVADLGVLKTYPVSQINGRKLEFVMGMSANERFGALGNWERMGFDQHNLERDPQIFVSTVVNNRADRVPRSRVFARMLVHDVAADRHVLIGTNIEGLLGFIQEEWQGYCDRLDLFAEGQDPAETLKTLAQHQRIALDQASLDGLLKAMLEEHAEAVPTSDAMAAAKEGNLASFLEQHSLGGGAEIAAHYDFMADNMRSLRALQEKVAAGGDHTALNGEMRALLSKAFMAKLLPVYDSQTSGEDIVRLVAGSTPPGLTNRIMGMQNIKGTGLDWVYRWQAWETVWKACQQLRSGDPSEIERGYRSLASFQEFGVLSEQEMQASISAARAMLKKTPSLSAAQLDALGARVQSQVSALQGSEDKSSASSAASGKVPQLAQRAITVLEGFVDPSDAKTRRATSNKIYKALIAEQISMQKAASELKAITARQKGGWLAGWIKARSKQAPSLRKAG
jgi:poly-gamma-glutamate synthase PgsB/CapB